MYKRYLITYLATLSIAALPAVANYLYLRNNGEFLELENIARMQRETSEFVVYGTALHSDQIDYKLALYRDARPKIVAVGSSRVQQFRRRFFRDSFINMGSMMTNVEHGWHYFRRLFDLHNPEIIIMGVDFWWFHESMFKHIQVSVDDTRHKRLTLFKLHFPFRWLMQGKITFHDYVGKLANLQYYRRTHFIGVKANRQKSGFGPDGSYYYTDYIEGTEPAADPEFYDTKSKIRTGTGFFRYGMKISPAHLNRFAELVQFIHAQGVQTIMFFPPLAPTIVEEMKNYETKYNYISELKRELKTKGIKVFDYQNPSQLNSGDCEFIDGYHGGDLTFAKIVKALAREKGSLLRPYADYDYVNWVSENIKGIAMIPDERVTNKKEVDFLRLGCRKEAHIEGRYVKQELSP